MDFVDGVLVRLADPASRGALFDAASTAHLVEAAYDTDVMVVEPPFIPVFDDLRIGYAAPPSATADGEWMSAGGRDRTEVRLRLHGFGAAEPMRVDALWRGALVVRTTVATDRIEHVELARPGFDVDPEIETDLGGLPADPVQLETERRTRVLARLRAGLDQPAAFTDDHLDRLLVGVGAGSVGDLVTRFAGQVAASAVRIRYTPPSAAPPVARPLPFSAAVLVRDQGFSLADTLVQSRLVRARAEELGLVAPAEPTVRVRHPVVVVWLVPAGVFDDEAWPGGDSGTEAQRRAARFARAGQWLANEGIGLVAVP
ncbi:MAG: hypothetical protein WBA97_10080 [Actinophytocola sp.]|uniref:hypothetical protein n=1 Tax=Actinophytocola sp. TaxID=1872138 RepID=UPI003C773649